MARQVLLPSLPIANLRGFGETIAISIDARLPVRIQQSCSRTVLQCGFDSGAFIDPPRHYGVSQDIAALRIELSPCWAAQKTIDDITGYCSVSDVLLEG